MGGLNRVELKAAEIVHNGIVLYERLSARRNRTGQRKPRGLRGQDSSISLFDFLARRAGLGLTAALWLVVSLMTIDDCSRRNPFSCHGPDPELIKYAR
jgi:hypothetical protein